VTILPEQRDISTRVAPYFKSIPEIEEIHSVTEQSQEKLLANENHSLPLEYAIIQEK